MSAHRPSDVLDLLLAHVLERKGEFVAHLVAHHPADANPARLCQGLEPCRDIDPVAVNIAPVPNDIADIDPDAELYEAVGRHVGVSARHLALYLDGATHRIDNADDTRSASHRRWSLRCGRGVP